MFIEERDRKNDSSPSWTLETIHLIRTHRSAAGCRKVHRSENRYMASGKSNPCILVLTSLKVKKFRNKKSIGSMARIDRSFPGIRLSGLRPKLFQPRMNQSRREGNTGCESVRFALAKRRFMARSILITYRFRAG